MTRTTLATTMAAAGLFAAAGSPIATAGGHVDGDCTLKTPRDAMTYEDAGAVYDCLADAMAEGYAEGPKRWIPKDFVTGYRDWTLASTLPADPGAHGGRFLLTYVNEVGAAEYLKFADEGVAMPAGSVIAKESFTVADDGKAKPGPLFLMQKAEAGASPRTGDWYYMAVQPNGTPMAVNVYTACNACHSAYEDSDYLAYPEEGVRASAD